ncbi:MAG: response regulator [Burkholderiales bacterium]|nr:response regulator [Burkholderiales bacterium]
MRSAIVEAEALPTLLLFEPETLLRRTVAMTARSMGLAQVHEAATYEAALQLAREHTFAGLMLAIDEEGRGMGLVAQVRDGSTACATQMPVGVLVSQCDGALLDRLKEAHVKSVTLKPFRVRTLLTAISTLTGKSPPRS